MLKKLSLICALVFCLFSCTNSAVEQVKTMPSGKYNLDMEHSSLLFRVNHMGLSNYTARFTDFDADLNFNSVDPAKSELNASVKANSIRTDFPAMKKKSFDEFLSKNENWFNSKDFPEIKFESTKIKMLGKKRGIMEGNLTMLGVTKPATFRITFNGSYVSRPFSGVPALGFSAIGTIKRSDWGFNAFIPTVSDEVEIIIETEFNKI